jgi:hypothetical protein
VIAQRMSQGDWNTEGYPQEDSLHDSEDGEETLLRNPNEDRTVRSIDIQKIRTVPRTPAQADLQLPERFAHLKEEQQAGALMALRQVDATSRQAVLDEWAMRCADSGIRKPAGYLFGIIQKAIKGEFNPVAGERQPAKPAAPPSSPRPASPPESTLKPTSPEVTRQHLAHLRKMLRGA